MHILQIAPNSGYGDIIILVIFTAVLSVWLYIIIRRSWRRYKLEQQGRLPKQEQALHTEAESDARRMASDIYDRAEEVQDDIPPVNSDVVEEARNLWLTGEDLPKLFRVLDALSLKILLVDKGKWKKAMKILHDAGIDTLPIVLLIVVSTAKTTMADAYSAGVAVKTEVVRLGSFLLASIY